MNLGTLSLPCSMWLFVVWWAGRCIANESLLNYNHAKLVAETSLVRILLLQIVMLKHCRSRQKPYLYSLKTKYGNTMKRVLIVAVFAVVMIPQTIVADFVSEDRAAQVARRILGDACDGMCRSRKYMSPAGRDTADKPAYYIFEADRGFAVIAGDDRVAPVLAYSHDNTLGDQLPCCMEAWLDAVGRHINRLRGSGAASTTETKSQWVMASGDSRPVVLMETAEWNQREPYNLQCPMIGQRNCLTGCVPTAYAIVMRYYQYPSYGYGTTVAYRSNQGAYVSAHDLTHGYAWTNMPMQVTLYSSEREKDAVSRLMADVGAALRADYGTKETSAPFRDDMMTRHFDYRGETRSLSDYTENSEDGYFTWVADMKKQLDREHPLIYMGFGGEGGHAFVIDGYADDGCYHVNWGWGGYSNGYFALDNLMGYDNSHACIFDFVPMSLDRDPAIYCEEEERLFPSLKYAVTSAPAGEAIHLVLLDDQHAADDVGRIGEDCDITLDLNGCKLMADSVMTVFNYGTLTVTDKQRGGALVNCEMVCLGDGDTRISGIRWENRNEHGGLSFFDKAQATIESSTILSNGLVIIQGCDDGTLTLVNTAVENTSNDGNAISLYDNVTAVMDGVLVRASAPLYVTTPNLRSLTGLFSKRVIDSQVPDGYLQSPNTDDVTSQIYPWRIDGQLTGALAPFSVSQRPHSYFSLSGVRSSVPFRGINIVNGRKIRY